MAGGGGKIAGRRAVLASMVAKDLRRARKRPLGIAVILAFPLIFSLVLSLAFGGGGVPKAHILIEDKDGGLLAQLVVGAFNSEQAGEYFQVEAVGEEGRQRMEDGDASALLILPEGLTKRVVEGEPVVLELVRNPAQGIMPEVAEQTATVLADLLGGASLLLREPLDEVAELTDSGEGPSDTTVASIATSVNQLVTASEDYLLPPAIDLEVVDLEDPDEEPARGPPNIFLFILPGVSVFALFMVGDVGMRDLLAEGAAGTLERQLSGPIGTGTLIAGKALYTAALAAICLVILAAVAAVAAGARVAPLGFLLLSAALLLAVTGFGAAVYGLARNEQQGSTGAALLSLIMAFLGGSFLPLDNLPAALRSAAPLSPFYWGGEGFRELLDSGAGVAAVLPHAGVLALFGTVLLLLGATLLRRRIAKGVR